MDKILKTLKKFIPKSIFRTFQPAYHFLLAFTGNIFYGFPGYKMTVIGVTGTNGKSTTSEILCEILKSSGEKVGMISTVTIEIAGEKRENKVGRTTIGRWGTHKLMREMVRRGCKYAVIEVASEGIAWYRIWGIPFDGAVFTNLAPEHLNYHKTMENYKNTKGKLFKKLSSPYNFKKTKRVSVVNADDKEAEYFLSFGADKKYTFGIKKGDIKAKNILLKIDGTNFEIIDAGKTYPVNTKALGEFNVLNELAAYCIGLGYDISPEKMIKVFEDFKGTKGKLISVFGATGDRDKAKRPGMGRAAAELTDLVVITDDETYTEDSKKIIEEVYTGVPGNLREKVNMIPDRLEAIKVAIGEAKKGDTVVVTGIGHQKSRNMGGKKVAWDERKIVSEILKQSNKE